MNDWDLVLFLEPEGSTFMRDGTRNEEIGAQHKKYSEILKEVSARNRVRYFVVSRVLCKDLIRQKS